MTFIVEIVVCLLMLFCVSAAGASAVHVARDAEQADPISGLHWHVIGDPKHPAAPPRLTLMPGSDQPAEAGKQLPPPMVCVRAGDHVLLRGNDSASTMSLEATALENGRCGARVRARVAVTGALVEMTVLDARAGVLKGKAGSGW